MQIADNHKTIKALLFLVLAQKNHEIFLEFYYFPAYGQTEQETN